MDLLLETFGVADLIRDVEAIVQPLVEKNGDRLVVTCPDQAPADVVRPALERRQAHGS